MYLEQLMLKYQAHTKALRIKECNDGLDFYYTGKQDARKMVDFLTANVPCRWESKWKQQPGIKKYLLYRMKTSQELVSHDIHNNKFQYKHTFSVEVVPVSKV